MAQLETERLIIREFKRSDLSSVQLYAEDPVVARYMDWGPNTERQTREFIDVAISFAKEKPRRNFEFAMTLKENGELIGGCGLRVVHSLNQTAEIGYVLNREFWKRGFALEAANAVINYGFEDLKLHRLCARCDARNLASARVMERGGMRREGHFLRDTLIKNDWRDTFFYAILRDEWERMSEPSAIDANQQNAPGTVINIRKPD
jgi:[ribosomal protein S5]-alanine N-acetyltransferase